MHLINKTCFRHKDFKTVVKDCFNNEQISRKGIEHVLNMTLTLCKIIFVIVLLHVLCIIVCLFSILLLCLSGQEIGPTGQRPLIKDSCHQNSTLWEEQLADPTIAYINSVQWGSE